MEVLKFIHTADLHLDSALSSIGSKAKAKQRRGELTDTFYRIVKFATSNNVDGIIVAGDMFDTKNASFAVKQQVADIIKIFDITNHCHNLVGFDTRLKILPYPVFKVFCLANVYNLPSAVLHYIYAGIFGKMF